MATLVASAGLSTQRNPNSTIKILFIIVFGMLATLGIICCEHATKKHGADAVLVRQCMDQKGPIEIYQKPDGRLVNVCQIADKQFGIMITEGKYEVTSYIKEKMTRLSQVRKYIESMGAKPIKIY